METKLEVGDVVILNSGNGPRMVVETVRGDGLVDTVWFEPSFIVPSRSFFISSTLRKVD